MTPSALFVEYQRPIQMAAKNNRDDNDAQKQLRERSRIVIREAVEARILRAIEGSRQLQEVMTAFWFNHFNIFAGKGLCTVWTGAFEEQAIRPHTMGKFRALLGATARHPAMLFYLDNWQNMAPGAPGSKGRFEGINENYARELMELHTLGVNGGYSQNDVIALAHILTGWGLPKQGGSGDGRPHPMGVEVFRNGPFGGRRGMNRFQPPPTGYGDGSAFYFDPDRHDFSSKILLGRTIEGGGAREVEEALDLLARHPSTAKHLSYQLAQYFVADEPPPSLVTTMAARYGQTDGDIREVLAAMFASSEFWDRKYLGAKFKTPYEYVISAVRAAGTPVTNFRPLAGTMQLLGMPLYGCLTPNGYSNTQEAWLNPDSMMARLSFATALGTGNLPLGQPPFDGDRGYFNKKGTTSIRFDPNPDAPHRKMDPPDPIKLEATLGNSFSAKTRDAIESAPNQLRASMIIGSPEFMKRKSGMNRREFLRHAAILSASGIVLLGPNAWAAHALSGDSSRKRIVVVFLRGAVDGLNVVVPHGEPGYYDARPTIAIAQHGGEGGVIDLDGFFGLHPALAPMLPYWKDGTLGFVHACGSPDPTRSHFDAQDYMESGTPGVKSTNDGWLNRTLAVLPGNHAATEALSLGATVPRILAGTMPVANMPLGRAAARPMPLDRPIVEASFDRLYEGTDALSQTYKQGRAARMRLMGELQQDMTEANNGAPGPQGFTDDADRLAKLIQRDPTIRVGFLALGGWDTHVNQGGANGQLAGHLKPLAEGLAHFAQALGPAYGDTVVIVISEFGRTMHQNGNGGTDHGHGNVMWVMGGAVRGRKIYGRWPGLSIADLYQERDLAVTTDFRDPIAIVLASHMGLGGAQLAKVFPHRSSSSANLSGLIRV
jgi:uncharacterized protein (DUF1800 family)/uncharacterized protein (DUF1501 family)